MANMLVNDGSNSLKDVRPGQLEDAHMKTLLNEDSTQMLKQLAKALNAPNPLFSNVHTNWESSRKKENGFHMN